MWGMEQQAWAGKQGKDLWKEGEEDRIAGRGKRENASGTELSFGKFSHAEGNAAGGTPLS